MTPQKDLLQLRYSFKLARKQTVFCSSHKRQTPYQAPLFKRVVGIAQPTSHGIHHCSYRDELVDSGYEVADRHGVVDVDAGAGYGVAWFKVEWGSKLKHRTCYVLRPGLGVYHPTLA